jgi:hypothetical protein
VVEVVATVVVVDTTVVSVLSPLFAQLAAAQLIAATAPAMLSPRTGPRG